MLRSMISKLSSGARQGAAGTRTTPTGSARGTGANKDLEQGAKSLLRGLSRKRGGRL